MIAKAIFENENLIIFDKYFVENGSYFNVEVFNKYTGKISVKAIVKDKKGEFIKIKTSDGLVKTYFDLKPKFETKFRLKKW